MAKRKRLPEVTTPVGVFKFPNFHEPYHGEGEYYNEDGTYGTKLILDKDDPKTQKFLKDLEPHYKAALAEAEEKFKALPVGIRKKLGKVKARDLYTEVYDEDTEEPTGEIEFSIRMKAAGEYKNGPKKGERWTRKPMVFDAKRNRIDPVPNVWGGTKGKINIALMPYFMASNGEAGLSLKLNGVQIIDLVEGGERSADSLGFQDEEGFEAEPAQDEGMFEDGEEDNGDF